MPMPEVTGLTFDELCAEAARHGHRELVVDPGGRHYAARARCTWCHGQAQVLPEVRGGVEVLVACRGHEELAKACRTWCRDCDLVTREEIHSGELTNPDFPGLGRDLPGGHWLCPRCVAHGR